MSTYATYTVFNFCFSMSTIKGCCQLSWASNRHLTAACFLKGRLCHQMTLHAICISKEYDDNYMQNLVNRLSLFKSIKTCTVWLKYYKMSVTSNFSQAYLERKLDYYMTLQKYVERRKVKLGSVLEKEAEEVTRNSKSHLEFK